MLTHDFWSKLVVLSRNEVTACSCNTGDFECFEALQRYQHYVQPYVLPFGATSLIELVRIDRGFILKTKINVSRDVASMRQTRQPPRLEFGRFFCLCFGVCRICWVLPRRCRLVWFFFFYVGLRLRLNKPTTCFKSNCLFITYMPYMPLHSASSSTPNQLDTIINDIIPL